MMKLNKEELGYVENLKNCDLNNMQSIILKSIKNNHARNNVSKADKEMLLFINNQYTKK